MMKRVILIALLTVGAGSARAEPRDPLVPGGGQAKPADAPRIVPGSSTQGNPTLSGALFGPGDGISLTSTIDTIDLTGSRTKAQVARTIYVNDGQSGPASGPGINTAGSASYGLSIYSARPKWNTSSLTGEIDGMSVALRQSNGDVAGGLFNIGVRNGFGAVLESYTFASDPRGNALKGIRTQLGVVNPRENYYAGLSLFSTEGADLTAGIQVGSNAGSSWAYSYQGLNPAGAVVYSVRGGDGRIFSGQPDGWVERLRPHSSEIAQVASVSMHGAVGVLGATRSSDNAIVGDMGAIGLESIVDNDNAAQIQTAFGGYVEATRQARAGTTIGLEIDPVNRGAVVQMSPADARPAVGMTPGLWLAAGGESPANNATAAVMTWANGARFEKGLVFGKGSLATRVDGKHEAVSLGQLDAVSLYGGGNTIVGNIYGSGSGTAGVNINFAGGSLIFETLAGDRLAAVTQNGAVRLKPGSYAALGPCNAAAQGTIAYVTDARAAITAWRQPVTAGGGSTRTFLQCLGSGWVAL